MTPLVIGDSFNASRSFSSLKKFWDDGVSSCVSCHGLPRGMAVRRKAIRVHVERLLKQHRFSNTRVNVERIARALGAEVQFSGIARYNLLRLNQKLTAA
ncbi:MAG: hypothetical protein ACREEM_03660 [Blastocatellia bacterium]